MGDHTATWLSFSLDTNANSASPDLCAKCKLKARGKEEYREGNGWTWLEQRRETGKGPRRTKKGIGIHHAWGLLQLLAAVAPMLACIAQIRRIATYVARSVVCVSVFISVVHRRLNQLRAGMGANSREPEKYYRRECTSAPPDEYDWTICARRRCGLIMMSLWPTFCS